MNYNKKSSAVLAAVLVTVGVGSVCVEASSYSFTTTNYGHSGNPDGNYIFVATATSAWGEGSSEKAPCIDGVTATDNTSLGSVRTGVIEFNIDKDIVPESITSAELKVYVNKVHENIRNGWMKFAAYETSNPELSYKIGGMDDTQYPALNNEYSYDFAMWTTDTFTKDTTNQWTEIDVKKAVINAINNDEDRSDGTRLVLRLQVPASAIYLSCDGETKPVINIETDDEYGMKAYAQNIKIDNISDTIGKKIYVTAKKGEVTDERTIDWETKLSGEGSANIGIIIKGVPTDVEITNIELK